MSLTIRKEGCKMIPLKSYEKAMQYLPEMIREAEVNAERHEQVSYKSKWGAISNTNASGLIALYVRATGEKTGYAYTENLEEAGESVIKRAYENGAYIETGVTDLLNNKQTAYTATEDHVDSKQTPSIDLAVIKQCVSHFDDAVRKLPNLVDYSVEVCVDTFESRLINSNGVDVSSVYQVWHYAVHLTCIYNGKNYEGQYMGNVAAHDHMDFDCAIEKAHEMVLNQCIEGHLDSGVYKVLLDRGVVINMMTTVWQMFSGLKYFDGASALSGKFGTVIGTSDLSIVDTNQHPDVGYQYAFDSEATSCKPHTLVEKGKFVGLLHNLKSAENMEMQSTGNAGRVALLTGSIPTDIIITPKILYIEPRQLSKEMLLRKMESGVYITRSSDVFHSINIGSGDFSIPCSGMIVKEGRAKQSVQSMTLNGNFFELLSQIEAVGDDLKIEAFLLKSYCIGAPSVLVNRLNISCK